MSGTNTVTLDFLGGLNTCRVVSTLRKVPANARYICTTGDFDVYDCGNHFWAVSDNTQRQLPSESRYVFTAEGYDVYDHGEYFSVVPQNNKGGSHD